MTKREDREPAPFAATLRAARDRRGLNQAEVAGRAGLTASYLSMLETRRKPPPSDSVIRRLARALDLEPDVLLEIAHLERTPDDIRARMDGLRRSLEVEKEVSRKVLRGPILETLWHFFSRRGLADASIETLRLSRKARRIVRDLARDAGGTSSPDVFRERTSATLDSLDPEARGELIEALPELARPSGEPSGEGAPARDPGVPVLDRLVSDPDAATGARKLPLATRPPHAYFWEVPDQDMYPIVQEGDLLLLEPGAGPENGDVVAVRLGERETVRTFLRMAAGEELSAANTSVPPLRLPAERVEIVAVARLLHRRLGRPA